MSKKSFYRVGVHCGPFCPGGACYADEVQSGLSLDVRLNGRNNPELSELYVAKTQQLFESRSREARCQAAGTGIARVEVAGRAPRDSWLVGHKRALQPGGPGTLKAAVASLRNLKPFIYLVESGSALLLPDVFANKKGFWYPFDDIFSGKSSYVVLVEPAPSGAALPYLQGGQGVAWTGFRPTKEPARRPENARANGFELLVKNVLMGEPDILSEGLTTQKWNSLHSEHLSSWR